MDRRPYTFADAHNVDGIISAQRTGAIPRDGARDADGEIFYAIQNGVRLTGMPALGSNSREDTEASWKLVHFIRHLPEISKQELREMEKINPKSPSEMEEQNEEQRFLEGGGADESPHKSSGHSHCTATKESRNEANRSNCNRLRPDGEPDPRSRGR